MSIYYQSRLPYDILYLLIKSTADHRTLARIARTCRALSDVALGVLWHDMESLVPLLLLIPIKFYDVAALESLAYPTLRLPRDCWQEFRKPVNGQDDPLRVAAARIITYGKRIKILRGVHTSRYRVHYETLEFLFDELSVILGIKHVMPVLTNLSLIHDELSVDELSLQVRKLFGPHLLSVVLTSSCRGLLDYLDEVIIALLQNSPKLVHIKVVCTGRLWDGSPRVMLDFESCLTPRLQEVLRTMTAKATSLKSIRFFPISITGYRDIVATPSTLNVLGLFKSITHLTIGLKSSHKLECRNYGLIENPGSAFQSLRNLRLRLHGSAPVTWFLDFINPSKLGYVYFQFMGDVRTAELHKFVSSLEQFKPKFAKVNSLSFRATICDQIDISQGSNELIQSVVTVSAKIFPRLASFKLKLLPMCHKHWGLVQGDDLPHIAGAFPELKSLKLAAFEQHTSLMDVVALARRFPRLRTIGINFTSPQRDSAYQGEVQVESLSPDKLMPASGLRTLAVRYSDVQNPGMVAAYLRKHCPRLWNVIQARHSTRYQWDEVHAFIRHTYPEH